MDSIKKKMMAMKMEKENAMDKAEQLEQKLRDTEEQKAKVSHFTFTDYSGSKNARKWTI